MLYTEACKQYLNYLDSKDNSPETLKGYAKDYRSFNNYLEDYYNCQIYIDDISRDDVENYMSHLKQQRKLAAISRNRYLSSVRSLFEYAEENSWIKKNVAANIKRAKVIKKPKHALTEKEVKQIVNEIDKPILRVLVIFLYLTGLRISSAQITKLQNIDLKNRKFQTYVKRGKLVTVYISDKLYPILADYIENIRDSDSDYLFATKRTGSVSQDYINNALRAAAKRLDLNKKVTCHTLRRSFATNLLRKGVSIVNISKLLDHESIATTYIYLDIQPDELQEVINVL